MKGIVPLLGIGTSETLRTWARREQIDAGARAGVTTGGRRTEASQFHLRCGLRSVGVTCGFVVWTVSATRLPSRAVRS